MSRPRKLNRNAMKGATASMGASSSPLSREVGTKAGRPKLSGSIYGRNSDKFPTIATRAALHHIDRRQATNSRPAILLAEQRDLPLNRVVTINFTAQGVPDAEVLVMHASLRARYSRWAKRPGKRRVVPAFEPTMIWVVENTAHWGSHWLVHIPRARLADFARELEKWIVKETGRPPAHRVLHIQLANKPHGFRKYMLKGIDPKFAGLYRVLAIPQGMIEGKRFGFTQNLGPSATRKHGTKQPYRWPRSATAASSPAP